MQPFIYFILFICHEFFTKGNVQRIDVDNNGFGNDLSSDIQMNVNYNEANIQSLYQRMSYQIKKLTTNETEYVKNKNIQDIRQYLEYAIEKRRNNLLSNVDYFDLYFQCKSCNPSHVLEQYSNKMGMYFNKTFHEDDAIYDIDKHFVLFDVAETSNNLFYTVQLNILNNITNNNNYSDAVMKKFYSLLNDLQTEVKKDKEEEMKYICDRYQICRSFPAFSDHLSELVGEIINVSDDTIDSFISYVKILIKEKINFFREFLDDDLISTVGEKLDSFLHVDITESRDILYQFRKILSKRHKFSSRKNDNRSIKAKALRLLIDIVDKSFEKDDDEVFIMYMGITKKNFHKFSKVLEHDMGKMLTDFIRYIMNTLKYNWTPDSKKEVKTLLEVLVKRRVSDQEVYEYLFNKGSQYVNTKRIIDDALI